MSFVRSQTLHEAQAGRRRREAGRGDGGRHPHHDLCVRGHVLQHAGAALLLLRLPGYSGCTDTTRIPTHRLSAPAASRCSDPVFISTKCLFFSPPISLFFF